MALQNVKILVLWRYKMIKTAYLWRLNLKKNYICSV